VGLLFRKSLTFISSLITILRPEIESIATNEHNEQARASHTNGPRGVPRCGALSLLQKTLHYRAGGGGVRRISAQPFCSGGSEKLELSPSEVALGPVFARARVLVHEVARMEELAKRRRALSADHAGLEEHRAWYVFSPEASW
jgi:hypothetical protein